MKKLLFFLACMLPFCIFATSSKSVIVDTLSGLDKHIEKRFAETPVITQPFPHLVIEDIFPEEFYQKIQANWPEIHHFLEDGSNFILPVTKGCNEECNLEYKNKMFWRLFGEVIVNRYIKPRIIEKFAPYFHLKLAMKNFDPKNLNRIENFFECRLDCLKMQKYFYAIGPHIDQLNVYAPILIYLPETNDQPDFGTSFYYGPDNPNPNEIYYKAPYSLKFAKKTVYKRNTLVTFLQSPRSWHSVEPIKNTNYLRRVYVSVIFHSPEFMDKYYKNIYDRTAFDDYYFDHRFQSRKNWSTVWGEEDYAMP